MKLKYMLVFVVFVFFAMTLAQFCIPQIPLAYAQEEDPEEEEPVQARPDPRQSTRGLSRQLMQKGALKMEAASMETSEVMDDGEHGDAIMSEGAEDVSTEIVSMPIDPYGVEAGADSMAGVSSVLQEGVGSASWDPTDSPAGWDPDGMEVNFDSTEMNQ